MTNSISTRPAGFTLIELLAALVIFSMMAAVVGTVVMRFFDARERIIAKHDQLTGVQKTFLFMERDLRYASNRLGKDEFGEPADATMLINDNDVLLELTAVYPDLSMNGLNVPRRVQWKLEDGTLLRLQSPVMDPDGDTRIFKQVLLKQVDELEFEIGVIEDGRDSKTKRWNEETKLPDMIDVTLVMQNNTEYRRVYSMQGGDSKEALEAGGEEVQEAPVPPGDSDGQISTEDDSDGDGDGG